MANRKINQEIEKCFKQVTIGVEAFDEQYKKYEQSNNASQRDKLVEQIKKECKKLQRLRDQIKTWAAGNEVKDKGPLQDKRELIETKMEAFKAVEKEMKTKAFSKEGLNAAAKLDPKEQEKEDTKEFLQNMIDELGRQLEAVEAETDQLQIQVKKSKKDTSKAERVSELEHTIERHKWHTSKLELLLRAIENEGVDTEQVKGSEEDIKNYVENNQEVDFYEDEGIYDDFNLDEEDGYGLQHDLDKVSSQDNLSNAGESLEQVTSADALPRKSKTPAEASSSTFVQSNGHVPYRRPSQQIKSPLPTLATLHSMPTAIVSSMPSTMKPAPPPTKPVGEPLKYASAAAAAAASDKAGIGIAPLPPPSNAASSTVVPGLGLAPVGSSSGRSNSSASPVPLSTHSILSDLRSSTIGDRQIDKITKSPIPSHSSISAPSPAISTARLVDPAISENIPPMSIPNGLLSNDYSQKPMAQDHDRNRDSGFSTVQTNGINHEEDVDDDESVYHLPATLKELVDSYEAVKDAAVPVSQPDHLRQLEASFATRPETLDSQKPRHYRPENPAVYTPPHYPQDPLPVFDDPRLYNKLDTDSLFYSFYYKQGTYQQYLAAQALKNQSWRFHKQYQTWFQRHEEPKTITDEFEQGTYRFFDYESTWYYDFLFKNPFKPRTRALLSQGGRRLAPTYLP